MAPVPISLGVWQSLGISKQAAELLCDWVEEERARRAGLGDS